MTTVNTSINIDTHQFVKAFTQAKDKEQQAEIIAETFNKVQEVNISKLATKNDVLSLEEKISLLRKELNKDINIAMYKAIIAMGVIVALVEKFIN